jgi:hypothetical protein
VDKKCYDGQDPRGQTGGKKVNHLQNPPDPNQQAIPPAKRENPWPKWQGQWKSRRITLQRERWAWARKVETECLLDEPDTPEVRDSILANRNYLKRQHGFIAKPNLSTEENLFITIRDMPAETYFSRPSNRQLHNLLPNGTRPAAATTNTIVSTKTT